MTSIPRTAGCAALLITFGFAVSFSMLTSVAHAQNWGVGGAVAVDQSPYRSYDTQVMPLPIVSYEGERFFIGDSGAGVYAFKTESDRLGVGLQYDPWSFDPSDSRDQAMKQLDKRRSSLMAGVTYRHDADWGRVDLKLMADVLGRSSGIVGDAVYQYPIRVDRLLIAPGIGMQWHSKKYNEYYFGIKDHEARRSGLARYDPNSGIAPFVSLNASYSISENWKVFASGKAQLLSNAAKDSPMTDRSYSTSIGAGVLYTF